MSASTRGETRPGTSSRPDAISYLAVLLTAACWATSGLFVRFIVADTGISAPALAFWRDLVTFLALLAGLGLLRPDWLRVQRRDLGWLAGLGCSLGTFHVFWNLNVTINGVSVATVQQAAMPAIVIVVAWLIWREALTWRKIVAIALTLAGTVLVSGLDVLGQVKLSPLGLLVGFATPTLYACWNLLSKKVREKHNPFTILTYGFGFGALVLLPFQFFVPHPWPVPLSTWLWFAGLIGPATLAPFAVYTFALGHLPASVASILSMAEIPIAAVYAYVLLDERLSAGQILGAALVVGGVLLLSGRRWQSRARATTADFYQEERPRGARLR